MFRVPSTFLTSLVLSSFFLSGKGLTYEPVDVEEAFRCLPLSNRAFTGQGFDLGITAFIGNCYELFVSLHIQIYSEIA